ncbi:uncharacterized protein VTP21DRAFT_9705 [Calcarisporiella thermophila]|uniref:uncharacterized protein n=1 Tax=Calcarisporiella thermophila TaxID=911321 RepID=UPI0037437630
MLVSLGGIMASDFTLVNDPLLVAEFEAEYIPQLGLRPRDVEDIYPATPLQTSFILALARDPQSYMVPLAYDIEREFDAQRLQNAWDKIAAANAILRTIFVSIPEGVYQVVLRSAPSMSVETVEWSEDEADKLHREFVLADSRNGFSLDNNKFTRFTVAHIRGSNRYRLFWTMHHSIIDGLSIPLLLNDLLNAYMGMEVDERPSFKTHVESILTIKPDDAKSYWKSVFDGATIPDNLNSLNEDVDFENGDIISVWAIVLRHFMRSDDVIFGCIINGRDGDVNDAARIIGALINTIPIRVVLNDNMTINDLTRAMQDYQIASATYSQVSLSDIKRWTRLPWTQEMFPTIISYQYFNENDAISESDRFGFKITKTEYDMTLMDQYLNTEYPLASSINALDASNDYITAYTLINTAKIGTKTSERMVNKFREILQMTLSSSSQGIPTLSTLNQLTSEEESFLLSIGSGENVPLLYQCLHHGFESNAAKHPDTLAVEDANGESITYGELDSQANALAHALRDYGVAHGSHVGLVIKRSIEMLVGILGILKAGGAYVPIDALFPRDRIEYILTDAACKVVVTMQRATSSLPSSIDRKIVMIDDYMRSTSENVTKPEELSSSEDTAYVVYTSGTTGKPKGVPIHHGGAMNCNQDLIRRLDIRPGEIQAQFMAVGFDGAVAEIISCFTSGGTLLLRSDDDLMRSLYKVQSLLITPTGLQHLEPKKIPNLRVVALVGESVPPALVERWLPRVRVFFQLQQQQAAVLTALS